MRKDLHDPKTQANESHHLFPAAHLEVPDEEPWGYGEEEVCNNTENYGNSAFGFLTVQIMTLCKLRWMILNRNNPSDHFATAIPMTANVCPMASKRIAFERLLGASVNALWPKPYPAAIVKKMV